MTLASFKQLNVPKDIQLSILVVDNNSTDATLETVREFQSSPFGRKHHVVAIQEQEQGHTFARNAAIRQAEGDLILWTDDDVIVSPDWLSNYVSAATSQPDYDFWGSRIEPVFESEKAWIEQNWEILKGCFAARDLGPEPVEFTPSLLPYGANFGVRTEVQRQFLFDTGLGRKDSEVLGEDELDLMRSMLGAGHQGRWIPNAKVEHQISKSRSSEKYVYDYFVGQGRALVRKNTPWHKNVSKLSEEARHEYTCYRMKRFFSASNVWVSHLVRSALARGQATALKQLNASCDQGG